MKIHKIIKLPKSNDFWEACYLLDFKVFAGYKLSDPFISYSLSSYKVMFYSIYRNRECVWDLS